MTHATSHNKLVSRQCWPGNSMHAQSFRGNDADARGSTRVTQHSRSRRFLSPLALLSPGGGLAHVELGAGGVYKFDVGPGLTRQRIRPQCEPTVTAARGPPTSTVNGPP